MRAIGSGLGCVVNEERLISVFVCFSILAAKMSKAVEELKLLLLQDCWNENQKAMLDALQQLLEVAEKNTRSLSQTALMNPDNNLSCSSDSIFSEKSDEESSTDKKTETYYSADDYDVSFDDD